MSFHKDTLIRFRDGILDIQRGLGKILYVVDKMIGTRSSNAQEHISSKRTRKQLDDVTCPICGKTFTPKTSKQQFCSNKCRIKSLASRKRTPKKAAAKKQSSCVCPNCGKEFIKHSGRQKFCCSECKGTYYSKRNWEELKKKTPILEYTCCICGNKFSSKKKNLTNCTCSQKCNNKHTSFVRYAARHPEVTLEQYLKMGDMRKRRKPVETRVCVYCGRDYVPTTEEQKYCSRICKDNAHAETKASTLKEHETSQPAIPKVQPEIVQGPTKDDPRTWETRHCGVCDMTFEAAKGTNVCYCARCLSHYGYKECVEIEKEERMKKEEEKNKSPYKVCSRCGTYFTDNTPTKSQLFCERCRNKRIGKWRK